MHRDSLGGRLKVLVSGGSALPTYIDSFFSLTGIHVRGQRRTEAVVLLPVHRGVGDEFFLARRCLYFSFVSRVPVPRPRLICVSSLSAWVK